MIYKTSIRDIMIFIEKRSTLYKTRFEVAPYYHIITMIEAISYKIAVIDGSELTITRYQIILNEAE